MDLQENKAVNLSIATPKVTGILIRLNHAKVAYDTTNLTLVDKHSTSASETKK